MEEKWWHRIFEWSLLVKGFNGAWELVSGTLVLTLSRARFDNIFHFLARGEMLEDPHDIFINYVANILSGISDDAKTFAAIYILLHGVLNIYLAIELHKNRTWAYVVAIAAMLGFMVYQIYRIALYHSILLLGITIFDAFFVWLAWHEYKVVKKLS